MNQLAALILSLSIEVPCVWALCRLLGWVKAERTRGLVVCAFAATLLTHPFAWHGNEAMAGHLGFPVRATIVETAVILVEGMLYTRVLSLDWMKGLSLAVAANVTSFGLGLIYFMFR